MVYIAHKEQQYEMVCVTNKAERVRFNAMHWIKENKNWYNQNVWDESTARRMRII